MGLDDSIFELRREKLKQIEALGQPTYRSKYEFTHTAEQILADYSSKTAEELEQTRVNVRVAGRIMAIRLMGKAGFAHLQQGGKKLQIYVKKDAVGEQGFRAIQTARSRRPHRRQRISIPYAHGRTERSRRGDSRSSAKTLLPICRRSGTDSPMSSCVTASAMSIW